MDFKGFLDEGGNEGHLEGDGLAGGDGSAPFGLARGQRARLVAVEDGHGGGWRVKIVGVVKFADERRRLALPLDGGGAHFQRRAQG